MKREIRLSRFVAGDPYRCTGCRQCELACFSEHSIQNDERPTTVGNICVPVVPRLFLVWSGYGCVTVQCRHCEEAPCISACVKGAVERQDGQVVINKQKCIGCKDCMMACPFGAIVLAQDGCEERMMPSKCDLCIDNSSGPACVRACPNDALRVVDAEAERKVKNKLAAEALMLTKEM